MVVERSRKESGLHLPSQEEEIDCRIVRRAAGSAMNCSGDWMGTEGACTMLIVVKGVVET